MSEKYSASGYEDFRRLASTEGLSKFERIGFPDSYRLGLEQSIFEDIAEKLLLLQSSGLRILDIGAGSSDLPILIAGASKQQDHSLILLDSQEMLDHLPIEIENTSKIAAFFPDCQEFISHNIGKFDRIVTYSVIQYAFLDTSIFHFVDSALSLLAPGGRLLIGDIPNNSKRKRFFASENGIRYHQDFTRTSEVPQIEFNKLEPRLIDDSVIISLIQRARSQGFDAYLVPQNPKLPMSNRREDILMVRP